MKNTFLAMFIFMLSISVSYALPFADISDSDDTENDNPSVKPQEAQAESGYDSVYKLMYVMEKIRKDYVDADKIAYTSLTRGAMKGMLRGLDPFCSYMDSEGYKQMIEDTEGKEYGGVGLVVTFKNNVLRVIAPMEDSPGFKAGVKPGDVISKIDGKDTAVMTFDECVKHLKGDPGTTLTLSIYRESTDKNIELTIAREIIETSTVKGAKIIDDGIAYVRITQFNAPTAERLDSSLRKLKQEGMKSLIIDLRGNPGGLLSSAIEVSSRFLETGKLVVYTEGREKESKFDYYALKSDKFLKEPIAILVDRNSASASEIVSGCLQDHKRAFLVGEKTFGKGSVQTVFPMPDGSGAIRLTTAKYYTPSNKVIHEIGIEPLIPVPISFKTMDQIYNQRLAYPGIVKPDVPGSVTDVQLERAIEILQGICLFQDSQK